MVCRVLFLLVILLVCWSAPLAAQVKYHRKYVRPLMDVATFAKLPIQERVRIWLELNSHGKLLVAGNIEEVLVEDGIDTVWPLAETVLKSRNRVDRIFAVQLLCKQDSFDPRWPHIRPPGGDYNPFHVTDGRRIGELGRGAVLWAAAQTKDRDLRWHAGYCSGLMRQEFEALSTRELVQHWRNLLVHSHDPIRPLGWSQDSTTLRLMGEVLEGRDEDAIVAVTELLQTDKNPYLQDTAIGVLQGIDQRSSRLRGTETGRKAIAAIEAACKRCHLRPIGGREACDSTWNHTQRLVYHDWHPGPSSWYSFLAVAFERFYGEPVVSRTYLGAGYARPEMVRFITYLSDEVDPNFPAWEYPTNGDSRDVFHPLFRAKLDRYHQEWLKFKKLSAPPSAN